MTLLLVGVNIIKTLGYYLMYPRDGRKYKIYIYYICFIINNGLLPKKVY